MTLNKKNSYFLWYLVIFVSAIYFSLSTTHTDVLIGLAQMPGLISGHILDFYDYYAIETGRSPGYDPNYMPLMYYLLGIWQVPMYLFGVLTENRVWSVAHIWHKGLNLLFLFLIFIQVKSAFSRTHGADYASAIALAVVLSPLAIYSALTFGQFDVYPLFFIVAGFFRLCRGKIYSGALLLGISMGFKYFGLFAMLPVALYLIKDIRKLFLVFAVFISPYLILRGLYFYSPGFDASVLSYPIANSTLFAPSLPFGSGKIHIVLFFFAIVCALAWVINPKNDDVEKIRISACLALAGYASVFAFINFHPQWIIYLGFFLALVSCNLIANSRFRWLEIFFYYLFFAYIVTFFNANTDNIMFQHGIFSALGAFEFKHVMSVFFLPNNKDWLFTAFSAVIFFIVAYALYLEHQNVNFQFPNKPTDAATKIESHARINLALTYMLFYFPAALSLRHPNPLLHTVFVCVMIVVCFHLNKKRNLKLLNDAA